MRSLKIAILALVITGVIVGYLVKPDVLKHKTFAMTYPVQEALFNQITNQEIPVHILSKKNPDLKLNKHVKNKLRKSTVALLVDTQTNNEIREWAQGNNQLFLTQKTQLNHDSLMSYSGDLKSWVTKKEHLIGVHEVLALSCQLYPDSCRTYKVNAYKLISQVN